MCIEELTEVFAKTSVELNDEHCKDWIKNLHLNEELFIDDFQLQDYFKKVADVVEDKEVNRKGEKCRNTVIKFIPSIDKIEWDANNEWIYIIAVNRRIVKIGGTRTGLKGRVSSYLCGHHVPQRGKSGKCSITNGFVYNTLDYNLRQGHNIEMYGYKIPQQECEVIVFGLTKKVKAQVYQAYETICLEEYKKQVGRYPILSDNADPNYK